MYIKASSVSCRERENATNRRYRKIATSRTQQCDLHATRTKRVSLPWYCIGVRTNCFLPYSFRIADTINTVPPMGNSSARIHRLPRFEIISYRYSRPEVSKWDVCLIDSSENNVPIGPSFPFIETRNVSRVRNEIVLRMVAVLVANCFSKQSS